MFNLNIKVIIHLHIRLLFVRHNGTLLSVVPVRSCCDNKLANKNKGGARNYEWREKTHSNRSYRALEIVWKLSGRLT